VLDKDRLLRINAQVIDGRPGGRISTASREDAALHTIRPLRGDPHRVSVAILTDASDLAESIIGVVSSMGWESVPIQTADLTASASHIWDLIVVAAVGETFPIPSICAQASRNTRQRVMVVSNNQDPQRIADALNSGADDYLIAPFDADECRARMRMLVKRSGQRSKPHDKLVWIEPLLRTIGIGSRHATLSTREWALLSILIDARQEPVPAATIEEQIWGATGRQSTLASVVSRVRDRLQSRHLTGIEIVTVRGTGYSIRFDDLDTSQLHGSTSNDQHS